MNILCLDILTFGDLNLKTIFFENHLNSEIFTT